MKLLTNEDTPIDPNYHTNLNLLNDDNNNNPSPSSPSSNDPVDPTDKVCQWIAGNITIECHKTGYYCPIYPQYNYSIKHILYIPIPSGYRPVLLKQNLLICETQPLLLLCPRGYYCPTAFAKPIKCPIGNYCGKGFNHPRQCSYWDITCPTKRMAHDNSWILFSSLFSLLHLVQECK